MKNTSTASKVKTTDNTADVVYKTLRARITDGSIRPNEMLFEIELAEELGVSRTPVREALHRLVADGLLDLVRRRWIVHEFTESEIIEIYEVRTAIEGYAAFLAATACTSEQREQLLQFRGAFELQMQGDLVERVYKNNEFHVFVVQCSNNHRLIRFSEMNNMYHFNFNLASMYTSGDLVKSAHQHIAVIDAIVSGEGVRAREIAELHVQESLKLIREKIF